MAHDHHSRPKAIPTHCPNPACARVHRVKSRYAGMRGRCPACASWMYVPNTPEALSVPMTSSSSSGYDERGYDHSTDRGVDTPRSPHPSVGWATTVFLLLGMVGLILLAISPLLPGHTALADGEFARVLNQSSIPAVVPDSLLIAVSVPLFALVLPLAVLWTSAIYQRPTLLGRLLCFSCVAFSSLSAFVAGCHYGDQVVWLRQLHILTESGKSAGWSGDVVFQPGIYLTVQLVASVGAALMFLLAAFAYHRQFWSRLLVTVFLGLPLTVGMAWVYWKILILQTMTLPISG